MWKIMGFERMFWVGIFVIRNDLLNGVDVYYGGKNFVGMVLCYEFVFGRNINYLM